jgi:transcriptional regulator with XRE-family HTH domain
MPKRRPMAFLRKLGTRMRARRLHVGRTRAIVAGQAEISVTQLSLYESGEGHPPAATLHRIAVALGTSSSALLGEDNLSDETRQQFDILVRIYADPMIGAVTRYMQDMTVEERKSVQTIAAAFAKRVRAPEMVEVMT